ncbi:GTPase activating protein (GAP) for Rho1p [Ascochyta rabiei]|uniref:Signal transduction n=1 Tax=Didymella rabiei TaxID=5454 RepID=A0A163A450_DIDRA|nr:GTPase activating protein (GAP) for Rho1p [Ascochyta rabiei]KZM20972.1 signal transduction [Ascochyta rabiei]UPX14767.1 GTPase activating protein (GAP) for Rho1p [Ascochyta rabiei]
MPAATQHHPHSPRVRNGEPQPAPLAAHEPASARRDLTSWWRTFSKRAVKKEEEQKAEAAAAQQGIFGVPLIQSIPYANVAISLFNEHGESYIYGYVPIVVAKCGVFLKEKATDVEGIFRLAGSEKRIKELKTAFDTPPRYGKGLDWTGYTVHDAANILRRYFNNLPEPIIPLGNYDSFRQPLRNHQAEAVGPIEGQAPSIGGFDPDAAVRNYQHVIKSLPSLNRQLLLYILDLLAVFAAKADVNKMTTSNLAAIFQPGILSHPQHDMSPQDYRLNQDVLIFLIDNQDHFLIGMEGTAVDEGTVKQIESGPNTPQARTPTTPGRNNPGLDRSASTSSSAGADSLRKYGGLRRNVSTSSKRSRHSGAIPSPITPGFVTPPTSGVHRSNTLPSKRSPALNSPRFANRPSGPSTPTAEEDRAPLSPNTIESAAANIPQLEKFVNEPESAKAPRPVSSQVVPVHVTAEPLQPAPVPEEAIPKRAMTLPPGKIELPKPAFAQYSEQPRPMADTPALESIPGAFPPSTPGVVPASEASTPIASVPASIPASVQAAHVLHPPPVPGSGRRSPRMTPTREHSEFLEAPVDSGSSFEPTPAVRTFTQILAKVSPSPSDVKDGKDKDGRKPNKLQKKRGPSGNIPSAHSSTTSLTGQLASLDAISVAPAPASPLFPPQAPFAQSQASGSKEALQSSSIDTFSSRNSGTTLKPSMSPSASFRSHSTATEYSEAELNDESPVVKEEREKRSFWKGHKRGESRATPTASQTDLHGSVPGGDKSMSSFGSSSGWATGGRRSGQFDSQQTSDTSMVFGSPPDGDRSSDKKGTFDWFHKMRHDHRERSDKRERAKSPPGSMSNMPLPQNLMKPREGLPMRDRSTDAPRSTGEASNDLTPTGTSPVVPTTSSASERGQQTSPVALNTQPQQSVGATIGPPPTTASPVPVAIPEESAAQSAPVALPLKHEDSAATIQPVTQPNTEPSSPIIAQPVPFAPISQVLRSSPEEPKTPTSTTTAHPVLHAPSPAIAEILAAPARSFNRSPERATPSPSRVPHSHSTH